MAAAPAVIAAERPVHLLTISAKNEPALGELAQSYARYLQDQPQAAPADICFTANTGRAHFTHRLALVAESTRQMQEQLLAFSDGADKAYPAPTDLMSGHATGEQNPKIAFLFTGQGSQYVDMGRQLYQTQPTFRQTLNHCAEILANNEQLTIDNEQISLLDVLYPNCKSPLTINNSQSPIPNDQSKIQNPKSKIGQTAYTQPALFALEYALARLWQSWGVEPDVVMGHSVGEYVAACIAGVFSLEDGLKLIAERGRLMQALPQNGEMAVVFADEAQVTAAIAPYAGQVSIAALNGPENIVISGLSQAVEAVTIALQGKGVRTARLPVSHAFHSPLMEPILADFEQVASSVTYAPPKIKLISNVTAGFAATEITTPEYWSNHIRQPVRFAAGMETLHQQGCSIFLEIGPKPTLLGLGQRCLEDADNQSKIQNPKSKIEWLCSLRQGRSDWRQMLQSSGQLYVRGVSINWPGFERDYACARRRVDLPAYPFQRQRYWLETGKNDRQTIASSAQAQNQTPILDLLNQGDTARLIKHLATDGKLSADQTEILDVLVKRYRQEMTTSLLRDWFYEVKWHPYPVAADIESPPAKATGRWLVFADSGGVGHALAAQLRQRGARCLEIYPANTYRVEAPEICYLNPARPADFERLLKEEAVSPSLPLQGVVHLWHLEPASLKTLTIETLEETQNYGCGSVLHLMQALVKEKGQGEGRLWIVTRGAVPVGDVAVPLAIGQSLVWGLGKVVALEHPEVWGGLLDLDPQTSNNQAEVLLEAIWQPDGEDHIAFRDGQRYVARLTRCRMTISERMLFHPDGSYLIAGGLGALGLQVAQWLAEQGARYLVLTGRSGAARPAAQASIKKLEQSGSKVLVIQADVSKQEDVARLLETVTGSMPPLRGIIHTAGVLDDGVLLHQNWERFTQVMAPKVAGAWHLHTLTQNLPLDFFVAFSSIAALLGALGQGNYAAANAFMDALMHHRRALGLPGLSINWGPWGGDGMASRLSAPYQKRMMAQGLHFIAPEQGLRVLGHLLGQTHSQIGAFPVDWSIFGRQAHPAGPLSLLSLWIKQGDLPDQAVQVETRQRTFLQQLQAVAVSERQERLMTYVQGEVATILQLEPAQLPNPGQGFVDMGMDSLMAVELRNRLVAGFGVALPPTLTFEYPTISKLTKYLAEEVMGWTLANKSDAQSPADKAKQAEAVSEIEQLTKEEFDASVAQELAKIQALLKNE